MCAYDDESHNSAVKEGRKYTRPVEGDDSSMFESGMGSRIRHERGGLPDEVPSRLLTKPASGVLASLRGSTYEPEYASPLRSLRPCWTAFLNSLRGVLLPVETCNPCVFSIVQVFVNTLLVQMM